MRLGQKTLWARPKPAIRMPIGKPGTTATTPRTNRTPHGAKHRVRNLQRQHSAERIDHEERSRRRRWWAALVALEPLDAAHAADALAGRPGAGDLAVAGPRRQQPRSTSIAGSRRRSWPSARAERASSRSATGAARTIVGSTRYLAVRPRRPRARDRLDLAQPEPPGAAASTSRSNCCCSPTPSTTLGCVRVELKTDARNERSRAAIAALPAQFEGVLRNHMIVPDVGQRDSAYYSVIDAEWPDVRANLERRLARSV